jgi:nucleotide-binding universal stress UspA family protein
VNRPSSPSARLIPGDRVDEFLVGARAHTGAQSVLYHVTGRETGFPLLMKVPLFASGDPAQNLLSFETEAMILPVLSGPHVPRFVAAGDIRRTPYLVMERVEGQSLEAVLPRCPLPADEVMRIGAAVADAVHRLHRQQAVHCDLKPENVILRPDGRAVLIDFGLAWHTRFPDLHAEEKRQAAGSTPFLSPEQILGVRGDPRSDVFSLGVILYELATGELPFGLPATEGGLRQRLWMDPEAPAALAKTVTPVLQEIILHCIVPQVEDRYQSAAHVAFDLHHPDQVELTERARKVRGAGVFKQARRWWRARVAPILPPPPVKRAIDAAPVIMVAVDTTHPDDERQPAIQRATRRILSLSSEFRLICVSVIAAAPLGGEQTQAAHHIEHLVRLRNWTEALPLSPDRLSQHVIQAADPSAALLEFAKRNHVDLIVLGAPGPRTETLAWWRSVASGVTANAHCSVYVVRVPEKAEPEEGAP